jgi:3',5'-cyclic AMP phosphodiesterase CpdA
MMHRSKYPKVDRRGFVKVVAVAGAAVAVPSARGQDSKPRPYVYRFVTRESGKLKLLAITDLHFFEDRRVTDRLTLNDIKKMIKTFDPELMLINGDIWFEDDLGGSFGRCKWACREIGSLGIPWAFVWGNHDTSLDHTKLHAIIANTPNSIYRGETYDGHYRIEICTAGKFAPFWNFIIVDNALPVNGFQQADIRWFNDEVARIRQETPNPPPAFLFCHVPLVQFRTVWESGQAKGVKGGKVEYEKTEPAAFDAIRDSGMVKAVFCGHDHLNNYFGDLDGVRLEYLRCTGHGAYGGNRIKRGGTIITIDTGKTGNQFDTLTVFSDGTSQGFENMGK